MNSRRYSLSLTFGLCLLCMPAFAQQPVTNAPGSAPMGLAPPDMTAGSSPSPRIQDPATQAMMAGMEKMNQAMKTVPMTGNGDQDFVMMMIPHHQGAIDMARVELRYGKDPAMRRLARDIIAAQNKEIGQMRHWLSVHHRAS